MWKAVLVLGESQLPVKLYAAVEDRDVHFHMLHATDRVRVEQRMVNPSTNEVVPREEVKKGLALEPGVFVELASEDVEAVAPKPSREITIEQLLEPGSVAPQWFDRPYYLGPDGAAEHYAALVSALREEHCDALAHWVMRGRRYAGLVHVRDSALCMITLHAQAEVLEVGSTEAPRGRPADARELALAEQLVDALHGELELEQFHDDYRARVLELIEAKARGEQVPRKRARAKAETESRALLSQLRASVAGAGASHAKGQEKAKRPGLHPARERAAARTTHARSTRAAHAKERRSA